MKVGSSSPVVRETQIIIKCHCPLTKWLKFKKNGNTKLWGECGGTGKYLQVASGNKSYDQPDSILKSRDITLLTKVRQVKAMVFPVVMYGCESCTVKKAER